MKNNNYIFSGNLTESTRVLINCSGEWIFTETGVSSENFRSKDRIVRNINVPGWIKKAVADGKAVKISKVEKKDRENFYVVRGEVLNTTIKRIEESNPYSSLTCSLNEKSENPSWLCISSLEDAKNLKFNIENRVYVKWKEVILVGEDEIGVKDSGYDWLDAGREDVTSQYLPKIMEKLSSLVDSNDYFKMLEKTKYTPMGEAGLKVEIQKFQPYVRIEIISSDDISMIKLDRQELTEKEPIIIPLKDKIIGEEFKVHTTESYTISGGDGYVRGRTIKRPVTCVMAEVTYIYENDMKFSENVRLRTL